jgi:hypothetical protein
MLAASRSNLIGLVGAMLIPFVAVAAPSASAQWTKVPVAKIPRTADGKPDLSAPTPRLPDGTPDLTGVWSPKDNKYARDISADSRPDDVPFQPWAKALFEERRTVRTHGKIRTRTAYRKVGRRFTRSPTPRSSSGLQSRSSCSVRTNKLEPSSELEWAEDDQTVEMSGFAKVTCRSVKNRRRASGLASGLTGWADSVAVGGTVVRHHATRETTIRLAHVPAGLIERSPARAKKAKLSALQNLTVCAPLPGHSSGRCRSYIGDAQHFQPSSCWRDTISVAGRNAVASL